MKKPISELSLEEAKKEYEELDNIGCPSMQFGMRKQMLYYHIEELEKQEKEE